MTYEIKENTRVVNENGYARRERVVARDVSLRQVIVERFTRLIWLVVGIMDVLLLLRLLFGLMLVNRGNPFAQLVFGITDVLVAPFQTLVANPTFENGAYVDMPVFFAAFLYSFAAGVLVLLIRIFFSKAGGTRHITSYEQYN